MRASLLSATAPLIAIALPVSPAWAFDPNSGISASARAVTVHRGAGFSERRGGFDVRDGDRDRRRRGGNVELVTYGGEWALYNNRSWESDSYNDWWHDRPERAYPRWMAHNQDCARMWWSGGGWRC